MADDARVSLGASPAKLLDAAKNACGEQAVAAAESGDFAARNEWVSLAVEVDSLIRRAISLMAMER